MRLFKRESLLKSARQIDQAGINEQDNNITGGDIDRRNIQKHFVWKKQPRLVVEELVDHIEQRLK